MGNNCNNFPLFMNCNCFSRLLHYIIIVFSLAINNDNNAFGIGMTVICDIKLCSCGK